MKGCNLEISFVVKDTRIEANLYDRDDRCLPYEINFKVPFTREEIKGTTDKDTELLKDDLVYMGSSKRDILAD